MRALLVEDSSVLRRLIRVCLRRPDIEFEEASLVPTAAGIDLLPEADLAVIGTYAPYHEAIQLIENLAQRQPRPGIVAMMTDARTEQQNTVRAAGADFVITMPFAPDALRSAAGAATRRGGSL